MKIIALGSNLPFKKKSSVEIIESAYETLINYNIKILKKSYIYQSEAYPNKSDPLFYNSALSIETKLQPIDLLDRILKIEKLYGRVRNEKNCPRTLDIDIISYDNLILNEKKLKIPHPVLHLRPFVILPIRDLDSNWKHPVFFKTITQIIDKFEPKELNKVKKII
tara:strand:+ start:836 stop:1330 length:495 start_codon:yes stop_codon:yes gene_type:complete